MMKRANAYRPVFRSPANHSQQVQIQNILRSTGAQAKLTIGQANDKYEQEADRVADQVMRMSDADVAQRQENHEEERIQAKEVSAHTPDVPSDAESRINSLKSGGQPLDSNTRSFFEPRFGHDFSNVRIHSDNNAADTAKSINARAFTLGNDVVMGSGEYQPASQSGQRLLGHELTHVAQQKHTAPRIIQRKKAVLDPNRVNYANQQLWKRHPKLKRRQLTNSPGDAALRREWWRYYRWGGGCYQNKPPNPNWPAGLGCTGVSIRSRGNCYRYAMGDPIQKGQKHSPNIGGSKSSTIITCAHINNAAKKVGGRITSFATACPKGRRKIAGVMEKAVPGNDYHWYRRERNGYWSHKLGSGQVRYTDASGKSITDPKTAD